MVHHSIVFYNDLKAVKKSESISLFELALLENKPIIIKILLPKIDLSTLSGNPIRMSAINGYTEIVRLLLADKRVILSDGDFYMLEIAIKRNHIGVVDLLLQDKRISYLSGVYSLLLEVAKKGQTEIVRLLLADLRTVPSECGGGLFWRSKCIGGTDLLYDLFLATIESGNIDLLRELLKDQRFDQTIREPGLISLAANTNLEAFNMLLEDPRTSF
jgi:hypothetical protein